MGEEGEGVKRGGEGRAGLLQNKNYRQAAFGRTGRWLLALLAEARLLRRGYSGRSLRFTHKGGLPAVFSGVRPSTVTIFVTTIDDRP